MIKLLQIEWMKLRHLNTMKVILIIYAVLVPSIYVLLSFLDDSLKILMLKPMYEFPNTFQYITYISSFFNLMLGVIIIVFTENELIYKTQRQNIIDGINKKEVILSKFLVVILLSLAVTLYTGTIGSMFGIVNGSLSDFSGLHFLGTYFVSTLGYFSFAYFFANLIRIPALAIILYLLSTTIEALLGWLSIKVYVQFLPLSTFGSITPAPTIVHDDFYKFELATRTQFALVYVVLLFIISYFVIKRRDI